MHMKAREIDSVELRPVFKSRRMVDCPDLPRLTKAVAGRGSQNHILTSSIEPDPIALVQDKILIVFAWRCGFFFGAVQGSSVLAFKPRPEADGTCAREWISKVGLSTTFC